VRSIDGRHADAGYRGMEEPRKEFGTDGLPFKILLLKKSDVLSFKMLLYKRKKKKKQRIDDAVKEPVVCVRRGSNWLAT
jgi:hypothetical protein